VRLHVNGELTEFDGLGGADEARLDRVLGDLGYTGRKVAVAVNETFVPRTGWSDRVVEDGDRLDVVAPIQGG